MKNEEISDEIEDLWREFVDGIPIGMYVRHTSSTIAKKFGQYVKEKTAEGGKE